MPQGKTSWRFAALAALPHDRVGGFQISCETLRIEQWMRGTIACELGFDRIKQGGIARECECACFIVLERWHHELRYSDRMEQARGNARGEGGTVYRQHRQPGPKRVALGRIR